MSLIDMIMENRADPAVPPQALVALQALSFEELTEVKLVFREEHRRLPHDSQSWRQAREALKKCNLFLARQISEVKFEEEQKSD